MNEQIYGTWDSPITPELLAEGSTSIREVLVDCGSVWWSETRPKEGGRTVVMVRSADGDIQEASPEGVDINTRVHSYGGGAWWVEDEKLIYSDGKDGALYIVRPREQPANPIVLTEPGNYEYADGRLTPDGRFYICVREAFLESKENKNEIVAVPTDASRKVKVLAGGADFYSFPRISPDGKYLAWIEWNHPNMAWDGTQLWTAELRAGPKLKHKRKLAGASTEWIFQPEWNSNGELGYVSDSNGWSALYTINPAAKTKAKLRLDLEAEIAVPPWVFGQSRYCFLPDTSLAYAATRDGKSQLYIEQGIEQENSTPKVWTQHSDFLSLKSEPSGAIITLAGSWHKAPHIVRIDRQVQSCQVLYENALDLDQAFFEPPQPISFPTSDNAVAHGLYYGPANPDLKPEPDSLPPLVIMVHGGPTSSARQSLYLNHRFWTSRGFSVLDVDYRGSTGYGKTYRQMLNGKWGEADTQDCVAGAKWLMEQGLVNPEQIAIRGGSAGGLTVLLALALYDVFSAGSSRYGIVNLEALAKTTHKFEKYYVDNLVGSPANYASRSPNSYLDSFNTPVILMSGTEDPVVPPAQTEELAKFLENQSIHHKYLMFEGEGHGFKKSENLITALQAELDFFLEVFKLS